MTAPALELATLTERLRAARPTLDLRGVEIVERARCGDGLASTADRVSLRLELGEHTDGVPERVVLKTILLHPYLRFGMPVILATARVTGALGRVPLLGRLASPLVFGLIGAYQHLFPHAPDAMYANEVRFYAELRPQLSIEAPRVYASSYEPRSGRFEIVMEDLRDRGARFPNATTPISLAQIRSLLDTLARLHAQHWASPRFDDELAWVPGTRRGGMFPVFDAIGLDLIRDQLRRSADKRELIAPLERSIEQLWEAMWRAQLEFEAGPTTLCHGDAHIGNTYLLGDDRAGLLDWQLMVRGCWAHDVSYLLATGLSVEQRRAHEHELLAEYLEALARYGVTTPPSPTQAWLRYRQGMIWGLVIGWLITPPQNYGVEITRANIGKMVSAMRDLDTLAAIPEFGP
jgi:aminoglycoside phosphotransferase (APT) family kinase protein